MTAAVNLQLRFSPAMLALRALLERGELGTLADIDVRLVIEQPWHLWTFLDGAPRLELVYHSIHYLDAIRLIAGEPEGVYCRAVGHPDTPQLRDTRSSIILDYGDRLRCSLVMNHTHRAGPAARDVGADGRRHEGRGPAACWASTSTTRPARPTRWRSRSARTWQRVPLRGSWFTEAFEGPMSNLQRFIAGEDDRLVSPVHDTIRTMALVEACYQSSDRRRHADPDVRTDASPASRCSVRIDAHQHFWRVRPGRVRLDRRLDGGAAARLPARGSAGARWTRAGIDACVAVQARQTLGGDALAARARRRVIRSSPASSAGSICSRPTSTRSSTGSPATRGWSASATSSRPSRRVSADRRVPPWHGAAASATG